MAKGVKRTIGIYINGKEVESSINGIRSAMAQLINEQNKMTVGSDEYIAHANRIRNLRGVFIEHNNSLKDTATGYAKLKNEVMSVVDDFGKLTVAIFGASRLVKSIQNSTKEYAEEFARMDDIYSDVIKYTDLTREEVSQLNVELKKMDTRTSREELNRLAGEAGKLGIKGVANLKDFVEAADIIQIALGSDLGEDAVKQIGKLTDMFGVSDEYGLRAAMLKVASTINEVAQSSTASEPYLLEFTNRLSGIGNQAGLTIDQIIGFGSVLDQNAQAVELSSTAMDKFIVNMVNNTEQVANAAGVEVNKLKELISTDMNQAILEVFKSLNEKGGLVDLAPLFKDLGAEGGRAAKIISVMAQNYDKIVQEQQLANKAFIEGTSVLKEYGVANNNAQAELDKAKNRVADMRRELGEQLLPVYAESINTSANFFKVLSGGAKFIIENKEAVGALVAAYGALFVVKQKQAFADAKQSVSDKAELLMSGFKSKAKREEISLAAKEVAVTTATTAATEKKTLASLKKQAATATGVTKVGLEIAVEQQSTRVKIANAAATQAQTQAEKAHKIAMASTPWGAILTAVAAVTFGIYKLATQTTAAEKAMKQFNEETAKGEAEARILFDALKKATVGSEEYKAILEKLKALYPDIINSMIDEQGELKNVDDAYRMVIDSIKEKIGLQLKEQALTETTAEALKKQKEGLDKIREALKSQGISDDVSKTIIEGIQKGIEDGNVSTAITKLKKSFGNNVDFDATKWFNGSYKTIKGIAIDLSKLNSELNTELRDINSQYDQLLGKTSQSVLTPDSQKTTPSTPLPKGQNNNNNNNNELTEEEKEKRKKASEQYLKDLDKFNNDVAALREKARISKLTDYEKEIDEIQRVYDDLIARAEKYKKDEQKALINKKEQAIYDVSLNYLEKYQKAVEEIAQKQEDLTNKGESNSLITAIAGNEKQWQGIIDDIDETIRMLQYLNSQTDDLFEKEGNNTRISGLENQKNSAISSMLAGNAEIIKKQMKEITDGLLSEQGKQIQAIKERYDKEIEISRSAIAILEKEDAEKNAAQIKSLKGLIAKIQLIKQEEIEKASAKGSEKGSWIADVLGITPEELEDLDAICDAIVKRVQQVGDEILKITNIVHGFQNNKQQKELDEYKKLQDQKLKVLQRNYDDGLISEKEYSKQKLAIETSVDRKEKELQLAQFKRQKATATIQAVIDGIAAAVTSFKNGGGFPGGLITMAASLATTGAQIALIHSQPEPFAEGGYIPNKKYIMAGEAGKEWIASNTLIRNPETAPVIAALENYQRGNKLPFNALGFSTPTYTVANDNELLSMVNPSNQNSTVQATSTKYFALMYDKMAELSDYLSDPNNRQATINRKLLDDFNNQESELRTLANLE